MTETKTLAARLYDLAEKLNELDAKSGTIQPINVAPARFVTIDLAAAITGLSPVAIRSKISKGFWVEGREYVRRDGRVFVDLKGYEKWVLLAA